MTTRPGVPARAAAVALATGWLVVMSLAVAPAALAADPPGLVDDGGGLPLFDQAVLGPGSSQTACLSVTASGALPDDTVTVAATGVTGGLAPYLDVTIEAGTGTTGGGRCTSFTGAPVWAGTLTALGAQPGDGAVTGWAPGAAPTRAFRITVSLAGDPAAMGQTATASFVWRLIQEPGPTPTPTPTTDPVQPTEPTQPTQPTHAPPGPTQEPAPAPLTPTATVTATTTATATPFPGPTSASAGAATSSPGATRRPPPRAEVTVPALPGSGGGPGPGGGDPSAAGLAARITRRLGLVADQAVGVVQGLAGRPQYTFGPVLLAVLFLVLQHLVDLRDPKLADAFRTQRDLMLEFPADYDRVEER